MRRFFILTLLAIVVSACTKTVINEDLLRPDYIPQKGRGETIHATIEEDVQTRVELNANKQTVWTKGDQIVRYGDNVYDVWTFDGNTGDRSGSFSYFGEWTQKPEYDFSGKYFAFYPYSNYFGRGSFSDGSIAVFFDVPAEQTYHYNSYDPNSNAMLGIGRNETNFRFKNLMGYLRISLTGDKRVKSITLDGNNDEVLSGLRYISLENIELANWYSDESYSKVINCGNGVQLTDEPTQFYFSLVPVVFEKGLNITISFTDGTTYAKSTSARVDIARNTIQPMTTIDTNAEVEWQTATLKHSGERIYAPYVLDASSSHLTFGYVYWGDNVITALKNVMEYYTYDDGKSSHSVTIKTQNATQLYLSSCAGISEIDLTNF